MCQCGIPRGLPDSFKKTYLKWSYQRLESNSAIEVKEAAKNLSIEELLICLCEPGNKWMPTLHCELDWIALIELSNRQFSKSESERVQNAWERRKQTIKDSGSYVITSLKEKRQLKKLVKNF